MKIEGIVAQIEEGIIRSKAGERSAATLEWNEHPVFEGVALKHLVTGAETGGSLSCHMVRVEPGCTLETHSHASEWELHEVLAGSAKARVDDAEFVYTPGTMTVIPQKRPHSVQAGSEGVVLLAKFFPALL